MGQNRSRGLSPPKLAIQSVSGLGETVRLTGLVAPTLGPANEIGDIGVKLNQRGLVNVNHVAGVIMMIFDVACRFGGIGR